MLRELSDEFTVTLSKELLKLSEMDRHFFSPHKYDKESISRLLKEKGNYYYLYYDESGEFAGYGMLRTFGKYDIPTMGCVIWQEYRSRGNGKKLIEELVAKARELHYHRIRLKVSPDNKVIYRLHRQMGCKKIGEDKNGLIWMENTTTISGT